MSDPLAPRLRAKHQLDSPSVLQATRRFHDALSAAGYDVIYKEVADANHGEQWWAPRLGSGIVALTAGWTGSAK